MTPNISGGRAGGPDQNDPGGIMSEPCDPAEDLKKLVREGIREKLILRLHPTAPVFLKCPRRDGERFSRIFRGVWRRIPLGARRSVLRHWRNPANHYLLFSPSI